MPVLTRRDDETTFSILPTKNIKFDFNAQHDCFSAKCEASGIRAIMQERVESDKTENFIVHTQLDRFILNMNSFHNPHLVRATISRDLWAPVPLFDNRKAKHDEFSARLRNTRASKAAKRQETVARKRARPTASASDADVQLQPPRKRGRRGRPAELTSRSSQPRRRTMNPTMVSAFHGGIIQVGLAPGRSRRTITRTRRALEADAIEGEESSSVGNNSSEDTDSDAEFNSGDDFIE
ncbi:hypothetical protein MSAN_00140200 [Mycena sanguinolenta]|uniref:Uncharacterized protein n=1 Tax=Mycena sanguinolenta TaxID=230812 RepID=A0A8H6ZDU7_9AGAR|nr:hypothetical protein MSAN_00140200 [Mycena sanguinolenta]